MPRFRVARIAPQCLFESRRCELGLAPAGSAKPACFRPDRVLRRDVGGPIVELERLVVSVRELEGVAELDPRDWTVRGKVLRELFCRSFCRSDIAGDGMEADQETALIDGIRMCANVSVEHRDGGRVLPLFGEERRL